MDLKLTGKRALVSGGSRGIGLAIARTLAAEGVDLVLAARGEAALQAAAASVAAESGRRVFAVTADTGDDASVQALVARAAELLGGIDILVNSASNQQIGAGYPGLAGTTDDIFWGDINIKVVGYLRTARAVAPLMIRQGWGRIINLSGLGARQSLSITRTVRNVSVAALTKNLADELGPHGINVTVVHPGVTRTESTAARVAQQAAEQGIEPAAVERQWAGNAINRLVDAAEIADVVAFLASPRSVSISGDAIAVGGGQLGAVYY